jgi:hypothetical protein
LIQRLPFSHNSKKEKAADEKRKGDQIAGSVTNAQMQPVTLLCPQSFYSLVYLDKFAWKKEGKKQNVVAENEHKKQRFLCMVQCDDLNRPALVDHQQISMTLALPTSSSRYALCSGRRFYIYIYIYTHTHTHVLLY